MNAVLPSRTEELLMTFAKRLALGVTAARSEEHTSELQSQSNLVCRLLLEKKKKNDHYLYTSYITYAIAISFNNKNLSSSDQPHVIFRLHLIYVHAPAYMITALVHSTDCLI